VIFSSTSLIDAKAKLLAFKFPAFGLKQNEQGAWTRTPELKGLGSDQVNRFVTSGRYARALSTAAYSGKPVKERVTLTLADGDQQRVIEFGVLAYKPEFILLPQGRELEYSFPEETARVCCSSSRNNPELMPELPEVETARRGIAPHLIASASRT